MAKREHGQANGGRPAKRQRRQAGYEADEDVVMGSADEGGDGDYGDAGGGTVQALGLRLWQVARDAVNKEGRLLSGQFLQKPPRKIYPDYYALIKRPIAFDDIRRKLDKDAYPTLDAVREDFELCFTNAKTYNLKGSEIYNDAKDLLKLVNKTAARLSGTETHEKKKDKRPTLHKLLKSRLQKLIEKTDDSGRILSTEFMELPSRKLWPIYYKTIKKPECLEAIRKRVKDKAYTSAADFAADVELVFANAMEFNQEHTMIWEDAKALRDTFHQLMSDMPAPFSLPQYSAVPTGAPKIKLKLGKAAQETPVASSSTHLTLRVPAPHAHEPPVKPAAPEPTLPVAQVTATKAAVSAPKAPPAAKPPPPKPEAKPTTAPVNPKPDVPAAPATPAAIRSAPSIITFSGVSASSAASPLTPSVSSPSVANAQRAARVPRTATPRSVPKVQQPKPQQARLPTVPTPRSSTSTPKFEPFVPQYSTPTFSYYPASAPASAPALSHSTPPAPHLPPPVPPPVIAVPAAPAKSPDPPPLDPSRQIRSILMRTQPRGRCIPLDHREGVKSWAIRLGPSERALHFSRLCFIGQEEEE
ncbi:Bromodomain-containing protein, partial [Schizophyllum fasciatum]